MNAQINCPRCGRLNPATDDRCNYCMARLHPPISPPAPPPLTPAPMPVRLPKPTLSFSPSSFDFEKTYHWANLIVIPLAVILFLTGVIPNQHTWLLVMWVIISGLCNSNLRMFFLQFLAGVVGKTISMSCVAGLVAILVWLVIAVLLSALAWVIALVYLWISSLVYVIHNH